MCSRRKMHQCQAEAAPRTREAQEVQEIHPCLALDKETEDKDEDFYRKKKRIKICCNNRPCDDWMSPA